VRGETRKTYFDNLVDAHFQYPLTDRAG